jgi:hypothetical protein
MSAGVMGCGAQSHAGGYFCCRELGHPGDHVACSGKHAVAAWPNSAIDAPDKISALIEERGKIYGDPFTSHGNIGLAWTGLIQQHFNITLPNVIPPSLVAQMMAAFKVQRMARKYHADNYDDLSAYAKFAQEFQQKEGK